MHHDQQDWSVLFPVRRGDLSLQRQLRQAVIAAIGDRRLPPGARLPSSRILARALGIARNTIVLAFQQLEEEGHLVGRMRCGYFALPPPPAPPAEVATAQTDADADHEWTARFVVRPSRLRHIDKDPDWLRYPYPFIYGQFDPSLFPVSAWRECARAALSVREIHGWAGDMVDADDPELVEHLRLILLPRRGIWAGPDEVILTLGAQQALYLLAELLVAPGQAVGIEEPGYVDACNIFATRGARIMLLPVDEEGLVVGEAAARCRLIFTTPSSQCPTNATMPQARREALLALAAALGTLIVEDDYEAEMLGGDARVRALKSLDRANRVLYVGSLSKVLAPGLRLGYIVAPAPVVRELRALRRLMLRHPPANNQRIVSLFFGLGHGDALLRRVAAALASRRQAMDEALARHLPQCRWARTRHGSSVWLQLPPGACCHAITVEAARSGVLVEPGDVFFAAGPPPASFLRLGFSSIVPERIDAGIGLLAAALHATPPSGARRLAQQLGGPGPWPAQTPILP